VEEEIEMVIFIKPEFTFAGSYNSKFTQLNENKIDPSKINYINFKESERSISKTTDNVNPFLKTHEKDIMECGENPHVTDFDYNTLDKDVVVSEKRQNFFDKLSKLKLNSHIKQVEDEGKIMIN
jgi:hypothetical protein